jgi:glycosyltransferase involved in cell wall biosynthesis
MMSRKNIPELSIVLPFYNEKNSIVPLLKEYKIFRRQYNFELLCVNNGSIDGSEKIFMENSKKQSFNFIKVISVKENKGYGNGIMAGIKKAKAEVIAWTHADMQTSPGDVFKAYDLYKKKNNKKAIVKGVRKDRQALDAFVSNCMGLFASTLLRQNLFEINAQPKLFHRSLITQLLNAPDDFLLDLYFLYIAKKKNYTVLTVSVLFPKRLHGKSKWAYSFRSRAKMIKRTITYVYHLSKS